MISNRSQESQRMNKNILIAIPAFNEEKQIREVLDKLSAYRDQAIIVNDGSKDTTEALIRESGFAFITHSINWGLTEFYKTSIDYALRNNYTHMITLDSDGQHDPDDIGAFIEKLEHYDLVVGNRFTNVDSIPESKIASNLFAALLSKKVHGLTLPDVACGFRGMRISEVFGGYKIESFGVIYDMLFRFVKSGKQVGYVEIPAIYHEKDVHSTKIEEIVSLINVARQYIDWYELEKILVKISQKKDFKLSMFGYAFHAKNLNSSDYVFHTDQQKAINYYNSFKRVMNV